MKRKTLFLKWCIINLVSTTVAIVALILARQYLRDMSVITLVMAGAIALVYTITTIYAGIVSWNTDSVIEAGNSSEALKIVRHASAHIEFSANLCPYIGLLGAVTGIFVTLSTKLENVGTAENLKSAVATAISGMGIAFVPTVVGIYACLVLVVEHHIAKHAIDTPQPSKGWLP